MALIPILIWVGGAERNPDVHLRKIKFMGIE
jgi:hypothetical protein